MQIPLLRGALVVEWALKGSCKYHEELPQRKQKIYVSYVPFVAISIFSRYIGR